MVKVNDVSQNEILKLLDQIEGLQRQIESKTQDSLHQKQETQLLINEFVFYNNFNDSFKKETREFEFKEKLKDLDNYEKLRTELNILKMMEFGDDDDSHTLEKSLMSKNKHLTTQITTLKNKIDALDIQTLTQSKDLTTTKALIETQKTLLSKLEEDLRVTNQPTKETEEDASLVQILTQQRDRYRLRNTQIEEQLRVSSQKSQLQILQIDNLTKDNLKMYEKIRYTSSYTPKVPHLSSYYWRKSGLKKGMEGINKCTTIISILSKHSTLK